MAELQRAGLVKAAWVSKWTHCKRDEQRIVQLVATLGETLQKAHSGRRHHGQSSANRRS
ncbi:hypothetical protein [Microbispora sitophila]|uniref:hypothetical protein n=1 Tax=Microbispora sitophila TaxID=2771537 RepID=UPI001D01B3AB|nr:hypothetical protein [Microbispora sitophila]